MLPRVAVSRCALMHDADAGLHRESPCSCAPPPRTDHAGHASGTAVRRAPCAGTGALTRPPCGSGAGPDHAQTSSTAASYRNFGHGICRPGGEFCNVQGAALSQQRGGRALWRSRRRLGQPTLRRRPSAMATRPHSWCAPSAPRLHSSTRAPYALAHKLTALSAESAGLIGTDALTVFTPLGDVAACSKGRLSKSAFIRSAVTALSCALCQGNRRVHK